MQNQPNYFYVGDIVHLDGHGDVSYIITQLRPAVGCMIQQCTASGITAKAERRVDVSTLLPADLSRRSEA